MRTKTKLITLVVGFIVAFSLFLAPLATLVPLARAAEEWSKYSGDLSLDSQRYVVDAWVIKDGSTYKMWYTHVNTDVTISDIYDDVKGLNLDDLVDAAYNLDEDDFLDNLSDLNADTTSLKAIADGSSSIIGYATSSDGKTWEVQQSNVFPGSTASAWNSVGAPCVIKDGTTYKMWYTAVKTTLIESKLQSIFTDFAGNDSARSDAITDLLNSTYTYIGYATSDNGINWTDQGKVFALTGGTWTALNSVAAPCVIKDDTTYKMWYTRIKTDVTQALLDSVLADIGTGDFSINQLLDLFDNTATVIGYATSPNGSTWTVQDAEVIPGNTPLWESVGDPCVITAGGEYAMLFTASDVSLIKANLSNLIDKVSILDTPTLLTSLQTNSIADFLTDLLDEAGSLDITTIKSLLTGSRSTIGSAFSSDSIDWTITDEVFVGRGNNPWGSVAAPCVIISGTDFELWYTDGVDDVTWQNFIDLLLGTDLPIHYAIYEQPSGEGKPRTGGPLGGAVPGTTKVSHKVTSAGYFTDDVTAESDDGKCSVTIPIGTQGLTKYGRPLDEITIVPMADPPPPPTEHNVIGLTYDFGPEGATFDPEITISFTYDPSLIPEGIDETSLVIAVWNPDTNTWDKLICEINTDTNTITAQISHFSTISVIVSTRPAAFTASNLSITPSEVDIGDTVTISLQITNTGDFRGTYEVTLMIDGAAVEFTEVALAGGASRTVTFTTSQAAAGTYTVSVDGLSGTFSVREAAAAPPPPPPPPAPAAFTTGNLLITPAEVDIGDTVTISAQVSNTGELEGTYKVSLKVNGIVTATQDLILGGGESQKVTFTTSENVAGTYSVSVDGLTGTFSVREAEAQPPPPPPPTPFNWWLVIGPVIGVVVIGVIVWFVVIRRRAYS